VLLEALRQKPNLAVEPPALTVTIIIIELWMIADQLVVRLPAELLGEYLDQRAFADTNIACNGQMEPSVVVWLLHTITLD
jgi:hypothetical protein